MQYYKSYPYMTPSAQNSDVIQCQPMPQNNMSGKQNIPDMQSIPGMQSIPRMQSISGIQSMPNMQYIPDMQSLPNMQSIPDMQSIPGIQNMPNMQYIPGMQSIPNMQSMPGMQSLPYMQSMPDMQSIPGMQSIPNMQCLPNMQSMSNMQGIPNIQNTPNMIPATLPNIMQDMMQNLPQDTMEHMDQQDMPQILSQYKQGSGNAPIMDMSKYKYPDNLRTALKYIQEAVEGENEDKQFYEYLISVAPNEEEKAIIKGIRDDEIEHFTLFRQVYYMLTARVLPAPTEKPFKAPKSYCEGLKKALLGEQAAVEKYRNIYYALQDKTLMNVLFEIITDEIRHGSLYNYLYSRNKCNI